MLSKAKNDKVRKRDRPRMGVVETKEVGKMYGRW